ILPPLAVKDFDFAGPVRVDVGNVGFTPDEIEKLAGPPPPGSKGAPDWWDRIWKKDRVTPPAIKDLSREFGYQTQPFLTDLISVAKSERISLTGAIKQRCDRFNFYIMRCGVYIVPGGMEKFEALKFEIYYKHPGASTFAMLPGPQTTKILE